VGGSFLFKEEYNDIDIFIIIKKGYKEIHEEKLHIIKLTEKKLRNPVFQSAASIAISNFVIPSKIICPKLKIHEIMSAYHEAAIEVMDKQEREMTRFLIFNYYLLMENKLLDGLELKKITESLNIPQLENIVKKLIKKLFANTYVYIALHEYLKSLSAAINAEKSNENLKRYKNLYEEIINETRRSKAEAA